MIISDLLDLRVCWKETTTK